MRELTLGYSLYGPDNGSHMFCEAPSPLRCQGCGLLLDREFVDPQLSIHRRVFDFSFTYDNVAIVSLRFKEFCTRFGYSDVVFAPLPSDPDFFVVRATRRVQFDAVRRKTRLEQLCPLCHQYWDVIGADPVFLSGCTAPLEDGFYRTDLEFGSGDEHSPLLIAAPDTKERVARENFRGLELRVISGGVA